MRGRGPSCPALLTPEGPRPGVLLHSGELIPGKAVGSKRRHSADLITDGSGLPLPSEQPEGRVWSGRASTSTEGLVSPRSEIDRQGSKEPGAAFSGRTCRPQKRCSAELTDHPGGLLKGPQECRAPSEERGVIPHDEMRRLALSYLLSGLICVKGEMTPSGQHTGSPNCLSNNLSPPQPRSRNLGQGQPASGVSGQVALATTQRPPRPPACPTSDLLSQHPVGPLGRSTRDRHLGAQMVLHDLKLPVLCYFRLNRSSSCSGSRLRSISFCTASR